MIATRQLPRMRTKTTTMKTRLLRTALIALLLAPTAALAQTEEVVFYHTDAIGSVRMITDATGAVLARYDFAPFGEKWHPQPNPDRLQFAGKERDTETGLDYFGARYYRPESGRFLSVDPKLGLEVALIDPQRWNRYSYVGNRPTRLIDPDGRGWVSWFFKAGKAVVKGEDVYSAVSGIVEDTSTIFSLDAKVGTGERAWATGRLALEVSGFGDVVAGIKGIGSFAMRRADDAAGLAAGARRLPFKDADRTDAVNETLDRIASGSRKYAKDGTTFENRDGLLPAKASAYYREYTVDTPGARDRGSRRIVVGRGGETYYTDDHYKTFTQIDAKRYF